jgi:hypothetical protein
LVWLRSTDDGALTGLVVCLLQESVSQVSEPSAN